MQQIAREFNFSESAFVLPPEAGHTRRVRIFTPATEVPFAGHPNVGTAFVLAATGALGPIAGEVTVTFEEQARAWSRSDHARRRWPHPVRVRGAGTAVARPLDLGRAARRRRIAGPGRRDDQDASARRSRRSASASCGRAARSEGARAGARQRRGLEAFAAEGIMPDVLLYVRSGDEFDLRARMFAPLDGVPEDPGDRQRQLRAGRAPRGYDRSPRAASAGGWRRASRWGGPACSRPGPRSATVEVVGTRIGGASVLVSEGTIEVGG